MEVCRDTRAAPANVWHFVGAMLTTVLSSVIRTLHFVLHNPSHAKQAVWWVGVCRSVSHLLIGWSGSDRPLRSGVLLLAFSKVGWCTQI